MTEDELVKTKTFRDRIATVTDKGKRRWVYALKPSGKWYKARSIIAFFYLIIFFTLPFIRINDMPLLMINVVEGKFILFSKIFWPQDFFIFAVGMVTFLVSIILFTIIFGRLFCGWVCPQTIFMEFVFRKVEWWIEGSPSQQKKREEDTDSLDFIVRRFSKHLIFFVLSFLIANTFLAYIIGMDSLIKIIEEPILDHSLLLTGLLFFTLLFYSVYAFVREIVCTTICPYGRLQGVMFDKDTMQIAYDYKRGEPRGKLSKTAEQKGDCIDCKLCVQVCPTGIDIRNGVQLDCVGCTACIDACNAVMNKIDKPRGLIRYASENEILKGRKFAINTRVKAYSILLIGLIIFMAVLIFSRTNVDGYISRAKGQLYQEIDSVNISNLYTAKIINKTNKQIPFTLKLDQPEGTVKIVGNNGLHLKREQVNEFTFFVIINKKFLPSHSTKIKLGVYGNNEKFQSIGTTFLSPFK